MSFRWSFSSVSICYPPESDILLKSYDHLNFLRASVVLFWASRYIMRFIRTFVWKLMTIWISRDLPVFNFERVDMWYAWIRHSREKLITIAFHESFRCSISSVSIYYAPESDFRVNSNDHLNFSRAFVDQFWASRFILRLNRTSVWKFMTIWNSRELPLFNFERLDMWCAWIGDLCEKLWPLEFLESFHCSI